MALPSRALPEFSPQVLARAKQVLDRLEKGRAETGGLAAGLGDMPLFAAALDAAEAKVEPCATSSTASMSMRSLRARRWTCCMN